MATTKYRHASDRTVGTNSSSAIKPPGQAPQKYMKGGENLTPSPTKPVQSSAMARSTSFGRSSGDVGDNSGKNGFGGSSSTRPGERSGPATVNPQAPTDNVLSALIRGGVKALDTGDNWQTRLVDDTAYPTHSGLAQRGSALGNDGSPSGKIPPKTGCVEFDPNAIRKP